MNKREERITMDFKGHEETEKAVLEAIQLTNDEFFKEFLRKVDCTGQQDLISELFGSEEAYIDTPGDFHRNPRAYEYDIIYCCAANSETFSLVVFDPPHDQFGENNKGLFVKSFGRVNTATMHQDFYRAFKELYRVLKTKGILIFKWNDHSIKAQHILALADGWQPLFGHKTATKTKHSSQTLWFCFMKIPEQTEASLHA